MSSEADFNYIHNILLPEFEEQFLIWHREYRSQERDLGARGEFVGLWRKAKKVKAIVWDGVDSNGWREGVRTILFEIIAHALLLLRDLDAADSEEETTYHGQDQQSRAAGATGPDRG